LDLPALRTLADKLAVSHYVPPMISWGPHEIARKITSLKVTLEELLSQLRKRDLAIICRQLSIAPQSGHKAGLIAAILAADATGAGFEHESSDTSAQPLVLDSPLEQIGLSSREQRAAHAFGIKTVRDLAEADLREVRCVRGVGALTQRRLARRQAELRRQFALPPGSDERGGDSFEAAVSQLSGRAQRVLSELGIEDEEQLNRLQRGEVLRLHHVGEGTWHELQAFQRRFTAQPPSEDRGNRSLPALESITARLGARARRAVSALGITETAQLLQLRREQAFDVHHVGEGTWQELRRLQQRLVATYAGAHCGGIAPESDDRWWSEQPASEDNLERMPLFSNRALRDVDGDDLHETYLPKTPVEELLLPARAMSVMEAEDVKTLGQLLLLPGEPLLNRKNFGETSLQSIRDIVKDVVSEGAPRKIGEEDIPEGGWNEVAIDPSICDSFDDMVRAYAERTLQRGRQADCICRRLGVGEPSGVTLEELAEEYSVTKERIRQICKKAQEHLSMPIRLRVLEQFWNEVSNLLAKSGGVVALHDLGTGIARSFKWDSVPEDACLAAVLLLNPIYNVLLDRFVAPADNPCVGCSRAAGFLQEALDAREQITLERAAELLSACCKRLCTIERVPSSRFSEAFVESLLLLDDELGASSRLHNGTLFDADAWELFYGSLSSAVEIILRREARPMRDAEVLDALREYRGQYEHRIHEALRGCPSAVPLERGQFVHLDAIKLEPKLLSSIADDVRSTVYEKGHVSAKKVYRDMQVTCNQAGIQSPRMLFAALQLFDGDGLDLARFPQIRPSGAEKRSLRQEVVDYVRDANKPCSVKEVEAHFVEQLGYDSYVASGVIYSDDVVWYSRGCVVHFRVLGWTPGKQRTFEHAAKEEFEFSCQAGRPYGLVENLVEGRSGQLPTLDSDCVWTKTLAAELLSRSECARVLGSAKNAYVIIPNDYGIDSFEKLVRALLDSEHGGAANLDEFTEFLREKGIIKNRLTGGMLGEQDEVKVVGKEIRLAELA